MHIESAEIADPIQQLYMTYYGRPADPGGLDYWVNNYPGSRDNLVKAFVESEEYQDKYESLSNSDLITTLYQQLFGRAPDGGGLGFYVGMLDRGEATFMDIATRIVDGTLPSSSDITAMNNRLVVANAITYMLVDLGPEKAKEYKYGGANSHDKCAIDDYFSTINYDNTTRDSHLTEDSLTQLMVSLGVLPDTEFPVFISGSTASIAENSPTNTVIYDTEIVDNSRPNDVCSTITYTLPTLEFDNALFTINEQGEVYFRQIPDYENPLDSDKDNGYTLLIEASDASGNTTDKIVNLRITDIYEPPPPPLISLYNPPHTQFNGDDLYGPIQYEWNSVNNTLTASTQMDYNIASVVITDENGTVITTGIRSGATGSITLDLQSAYDGGDDSFEQINNFDMNEYFAYITKTAYTFTFTDVYGNVVEESYSLIVNKGLNLPRGNVTSQDQREMILMAKRSGEDGVNIATAGENSDNRDVWLDTNNNGIEGDRFYAETVKDWGGKNQWVSSDPGSYVEGSEINQLRLSFNRGAAGSAQVFMTFPDDTSDEAIINLHSNNGIVSSITAVQFYNVTLGMNNSDLSILIGNDSNNSFSTYGNKYIAYGMGGNDYFSGDVGDSIIIGGTGTDTYDFKWDNWATDAHIYLDLLDLSEQWDDAQVSLGFFAAAELISDSTEAVLAIDFLQGIERIKGSPAGDFIFGSDGDESIYGASGDDNIEGGGGNDYLVGGPGDDDIEGGAGDDIIYGENDKNLPPSEGFNTLDGDEGNDIIYGGNGTDDMYGDDGDDILYGGNGDDFVFGDDDEDILYGGEGSDYMRGGTGDDILIPGPGPDSLYGDQGNDIFVFHNITSSTILNSVYGFGFNNGSIQQDSIQLSVGYSTLPIQKIFDDTNGFDAETMEYFLSDPNYDSDNSDMINGPIDSNSFLLVSDGTHTTFFLVTNDSDAQIDSTEINEIIWFHSIDDVNFLDNNIVYSNEYQLIG